MLQKLSKCEVMAKNEFLQFETLIQFGNSGIHLQLNCVKSILTEPESQKLPIF